MHTSNPYEKCVTHCLRGPILAQLPLASTERSGLCEGAESVCIFCFIHLSDLPFDTDSFDTSMKPDKTFQPATTLAFLVPHPLALDSGHTLMHSNVLQQSACNSIINSPPRHTL